MHTCVTKEVFIPLAQLKERLVGDPKSRLQAYQLDWLTYCAQRSPENDLISGWRGTYVPEIPDQQRKRWQDKWNGSHLWIRNNVGNAPTNAGAHFLRQLLAPSNLDPKKIFNNIPLFIFYRWARKFSSL